MGFPPLTGEDLDNRFGYHRPADDGVVIRHQRIRQACRYLAGQIVEVTGGPTREQSLAVAAVEEACMWANAAIARHQHEDRT